MRQTLLFSATMPNDIEEISRTYLRNPVRVQVAPPGKPVEKIVQGVHYIPNGDKAKLLESYLLKHPGEQALVFGRTKHGAEKLYKLLVAWGFKASSIHGNKSQNHRDRTLTEFREGQLDVLVATDVAARGIDIPGVRHVYNYDMPNVPENYVHRIGRTARAGAGGVAIAFCDPTERPYLKSIEKLIRVQLAVAGSGGKVRLFDVADPARPVLDAIAPGSFGGAVEALAFDPAGVRGLWVQMGENRWFVERTQDGWTRTKPSEGL